MSNVVKDILNKGVPVQTPVLLDLGALMQNFSENDKLKREFLHKIYGLFQFVGELTECDVSKFLTFNFGTIVGGKDVFSKNIHFAVENYYLTFSRLLNTTSHNLADKILQLDETFFHEQEYILRNIRTEKELRRKYPDLYDAYLLEQKQVQEVLKLDQILNDKKIDFVKKLTYRMEFIKGYQKYYKGYDLDKEIEYAKGADMNSFIEKFIHIMKCLRENSDEIINYMLSEVIEFRSLTKKDAEKVELYLIHYFLWHVEQEDILDKQRYLYYVTNYFRENPDVVASKEKIVLENKVVTAKSLYERYKKALVRYPELKVIHFNKEEFASMTIREVEEFMDEFLKGLSANWEFLPQNSDALDKKVFENFGKSKNVSGGRLSHDELVELYLEKKSFYDGTDPYYRIQGKNTFDGYVGFIYSNGKVVLDKFYDNVNTGRIAYGAAIYVMGIDEFCELSHYSRSYLWANHSCLRIVHDKDWKEKVMNAITTRDKEINTVEETKKLIREKNVVKDN